MKKNAADLRMKTTPDLRESAPLVNRRWDYQSGFGSDASVTVSDTADSARGPNAGATRVGPQAATPTADWTVGQFSEWWVDAMRIALRPRTWESYDSVLHRHVLPSLGSRPLTQLSALELHELYAERRAAGLSRTSVQRIHRVVHRALADAVCWGLIPYNPASAVHPPMPSEVEYRTLSVAEAHAFLEAARDDRLEALFVLAITTGMRLGELLGLRWQDIDFERHLAQVRRTVQWLRGGPALLGTKTGHSRAVCLPQVTIDALLRHRDYRCVAPAGDWADAGLVFTTTRGRPISPSNLHRSHFRPLLERAGIPRIRFHDLRHTAATLLLEQGVHPKVVAEMLGHARVGITLDIYSHVTDTLQQQAAATFDTLFGQRASSMRLGR